MMPGENYVIYGCSSARTTPEVSLYRSLTLEEKYCCSYITQDKVINDNLKRQIKNRTLYSCRLLAIGQKYFRAYPPSFFDIARVPSKFPIFL